MSVHFSAISDSNPVTVEDVRRSLGKLGIVPQSADEDDFSKLLATTHDIAKTVEEFPDYEPPSGLERFPRKNIQRPSAEQQNFGAAWAHTFSIKDPSITGPLAGKTVALKDCIAVAQVPQLLGTEIIEPWTPKSDATVVTWLLENGAELVGTANCEDWCQTTASFSSAHGIVDNPYSVGYSAGGSSSGCAALVAGGIVDISIGADQGGSIRVPAALCGCVGLKPTYGSVPYTGIASNDAVNDTAGPMSRTVMDTALCLDAISGYDGIDDRALGAPKRGTTNFAADLKASAPDGVKGMRIGILKEAFEHAAVDPSMKAFVLSAAWKFRDLGASVEEVSIPYHSKSTTIWTIAERISGCLTLLGLQHGRRGFAMTDIEAAKLPWTQEKFDKAFPTTQNILINGLYLMEKFPALYPKAVNLERRLLDVYEDAFKEYDVLILPSTSFVAPKHGTRTTPIPTIAPTVGLTANTAAFNATGQPAMSIPIGFLPAKEDPAVLLPVGMQIVGGLWKDSKVLRVGHAWEKAYNWKERRQE